MIKKNPKADLRSSHYIRVQIGIICTLLFFIAASKAEIKKTKIKESPIPIIFEPDSLITTPPVIPPEKPAPHKPSVFNVVPTDEPMEPDVIHFSDFEFDGPIAPPPPEEKPEKDVHDVFGLEFLPKMHDGLPALYKEIKYPEVARKAAIEGRVYVEFIVNKQGKVENPRVIRGIGGGCDEEVLRVIRLMTFTPGIQNGKFVKVRMAQSVSFKLQN